jgi:predicted metal-dependent peptidase
MAVIDTSRSMTHRHLEHVLQELRQLAKIGSVTVVECDNEIRGTYPLRGRIERLAGRGTTDLRPALAPSRLALLRPDVTVYFTDGDGPAPIHAPRVPVIWCLTPGGRRPADWGLAVELLPAPADSPASPT